MRGEYVGGGGGKGNRSKWVCHHVTKKRVVKGKGLLTQAEGSWVF